MFSIFRTPLMLLPLSLPDRCSSLLLFFDRFSPFPPHIAFRYPAPHLNPGWRGAPPRTSTEQNDRSSLIGRHWNSLISLCFDPLSNFFSPFGFFSSSFFWLVFQTPFKISYRPSDPALFSLTPIAGGLPWQFFSFSPLFFFPTPLDFFPPPTFFWYCFFFPLRGREKRVAVSKNVSRLSSFCSDLG